MADRDSVAQANLEATIGDMLRGAEDVVSTYPPGQVPESMRVLIEGFEAALARYRAEQEGPGND